MKKCIKCGLPETYETLEFEENQICNICNQSEYASEKINWSARKSSLDNLIEKYRGKYEYDCIIPFSGGKDSTWTLYYLVKEYKIKPLVVQFDHGFMRPNLLKNNERTFNKLGVEVLKFKPNWKIVRRVMLESLLRKGDFCWHCHTGIFAFPMQIALKFNTPLVFWGEPSAEYTAYYDYRDDEIELVNEEKFNSYINLGITADDMSGMISDIEFDPRDLAPFQYPLERDLKKLGYHSVCLGSYIKWDTKKQSKIIMNELGWQGDQVEGMPDEKYNYEKIECWMQGVRDYLKYLKRGYSRVSQMTALDIRNNRISKEEAIDLVNKWEGARPHSLDIFLEYVRMTESEFNDLAMKLAVHPNRPDLNNNKKCIKPKDFSDWYRESN